MEFSEKKRKEKWKKKECGTTWAQNEEEKSQVLLGLSVVTSSSSRRMDATRACFSYAVRSSGSVCPSVAAPRNAGRSPARRCNQQHRHSRRRTSRLVAVAATSSPPLLAWSSPFASSPSSSSSSPEPQFLPNWPHTPGARRLPQQMRRRETGTALLSSSSLRPTPAMTTSGPSSNNLSDGVETRFVAETLLPTRLGNFRLRGYIHTVGTRKTERGTERDREKRPSFISLGRWCSC